MKLRKIVFLLCVLIAGILVTNESKAQAGHPHYLRALSDLRAARWMLHNRPGNWQQTKDETSAENEITAAIGEIIKASVDDGKNIDYHPPVDEKPGHVDRLMAALDFLRKANQDLSQEEDNNFAKGLRAKSQKHIDIAMKAIDRAMHF